MEYKERIKFTEEAVVLIEKGASFSDIENGFIEKKFYQKDKDKVIFFLKKSIEEKYGSQISQYLIDDSIESKRNEYSFMEEGVFSFLVKKEIGKLKENSKKKVDELMSQKMDENEIISKIVNKYFSKEEAQKQIDEYIYFKRKIGWGPMLGYILLGLGAMVAGIAVIAVERIFIGIFLFGFGILSLRKAFSTKAQIEMLSD